MTVRHLVSLRDPHAHLVSLASTFGEGMVLPDPLVLVMPVWTPGSYLLREYSRHLERPHAVGMNGEPIAVTKLRKNAWEVHHHGAREVTFHYDLYCNELSVRTNHVDATHVYLNGAATFLTAAHAPNDGAVVTLDVPAGWKIATAMSARAATPGVFEAASFDELVDSPIHAGHHHSRTFEVLGKPHEFAIWGDSGTIRWDDIVRDTRLIIETEARWCGASLPYDRYTFIWLITPRVRGGLEHRHSTTLSVTSTLFDERKGYLDVLSLIAHEFLHLWNVKRIRPEGLFPYRYEEENYTGLLWWFEGATSYYDWRVLRLAGLCTVDEYLEHLGEEMARLGDTPGRLAQSVREASFDAWIKLYRSDENTVNSTVSYYLKGEIVCALLDVEMRARTGGTHTLDEVLTRLWNDYGRDERPVPEDAMSGVFAQVAGVSMDDVLSPWVDGREDLPIEATFAKIGLRVSGDPTGERRKVSIGLRMRTVEGRALVASVLRGRAGHRAGIDAGDEIVAIAGKRIDGGKIEGALQGLEPGAHADVLLARDGALRTVTVTFEPATPDRLRIVLDPSASPTQRSLLEGWLHGTPSKGGT